MYQDLVLKKTLKSSGAASSNDNYDNRNWDHSNVLNKHFVMLWLILGNGPNLHILR
jgi:hypothetical protein